jgi:hypothetical protein
MFLVSVVGTAIGIFEPQLVGFILDRMPVDNPMTKVLLAARTGRVVSAKRDKKKKRQ